MAIWNITTQDYLNQERSLFEVVGVASSDGQVISYQNPFPVSDAGGSLTVDGHVGLDTGTNSIGTVGINTGINHIGSIQIDTGIGNSAASISNPLAVTISQFDRAVSEVNPLFITAAPGSTAAFGEFSFAELTPLVQVDAIYGVSNDLLDQTQTYTALGGLAGIGTTVSGQFNMFGVQSSSTQYSYGVIRTKRFMRYRPGQGAVGRFTAQFTATGIGSTYVGKAGTQQRAGLFNQEDALQIGYNGTDFGILLSRQGKAHIHRFTITAGPAASTNATIVLNGVSYTVPLVSGETTSETAARIARFTFTGWLVEQIGAEITFLSSSTGPQEGTYSFTHATATATITNVRAGVSSQDIWINQDQWNVDQMTGVGGTTNPTGARLDPSKLNVYQIQFRWLGAGIIRFSVEDPRENSYGALIVMHTIHWSNKYTSTHLGNPAMKLGLVAYNLGGPTGIVTVSSGSWMMGIEGKVVQNDYPRSTSASKSSLAANTIHHVLSVQNPIVRSNVLNAKEVNPLDLTVGTKFSGATASVEVMLFLDPTPSTGNYIFAQMPQSALAKSTSTMTFSDTVNTPVASFICAANDNQQIDLSHYRTIIPAGGILSVGVRCTETIDSIVAALVWVAD
jgi:hypothetical protein